MPEIIVGVLQPNFLLLILGAVFVYILFNPLIEAKTEELKERTRKLKRENEVAERHGNSGTQPS